MDIYAWSSGIPNLGDDLNQWLWKRVLPASFLSQEGTLIGIGSVLHEEHLSKIKNTTPLHVLGAGCRNEQNPIQQLSQELKIHALRGPLSAQALRLEDSITTLDAAYALRFTSEYQTLIQLPKKFEYTLIPYFRSKELIFYNAIAQRIDVNILHSSNYGSIENALQNIAQSKFIISESLHGAILADALGVPWARLKFYLHNPIDEATAEFKWNDWLSSIEMNDLNYLNIPLRYSSWISKYRNWMLMPIRTWDYYHNFTTKLQFRLSERSLLKSKLDQLKSTIDNLGL